MRRVGSPCDMPARESVPLRTLSVALLTLAAACDAPPRQGERSAVRAPTAEAAPRTASEPPVLAFDGANLAWGDLRPSLVELGGATVVGDAILGRAIERELAARSLPLAPGAIDAERELLQASLDPDPNRSFRLLEEIRRRQGLGPVRFAAFLRRNAGLRALAQSELEITDEALAAQHDVLHGPRRRARLAALATLADAEAFRREVEAGASFGELAARRSTDPSAARGGLLEPVSRRDPSYPLAFRSTLFAAPVGGISEPSLVDGSWLVVQVVEELPGSGRDLAATRAEIEPLVRRAQERLVMDRIARRLIATADPVFFDPGLEAEWRKIQSGR
jgi:hypothetical protein